MEQKSFPFRMNDNKIYEKIGADKVWVSSGQSGLLEMIRIMYLTIC